MFVNMLVNYQSGHCQRWISDPQVRSPERKEMSWPGIKAKLFDRKLAWGAARNGGLMKYSKSCDGAYDIGNGHPTMSAVFTARFG